MYWKWRNSHINTYRKKKVLENLKMKYMHNFLALCRFLKRKHWKINEDNKYQQNDIKTILMALVLKLSSAATLNRISCSYYWPYVHRNGTIIWMCNKTYMIACIVFLSWLCICSYNPYKRPRSIYILYQTYLSSCVSWYEILIHERLVVT